MANIDILTLADEAEWLALLEQIPARGLGHYPRFARVYEEKGDGLAECFVYREGSLLALYPYIRRPVSRLAFIGEHFGDYSDIVTPYCYGGHIHNAPENRAAEFVKALRNAFDAHARETGVVSEFVRFHPLLQNQAGCKGMFDHFFLHRDNIVVDSRRNEEALFRQCRPTFRRSIKKARRNGLEFEAVSPEDMGETFATLYGKTMTRHNQTGYLNFGPDFFRILFRNLKADCRLFAVRGEKHVIAAALFLEYGGTMDYFLGASDREFFSLFPNHLIMHGVTCWAHDRGIETVHLGGGRKSLYFFKSGFSKKTVPFYVGHTVHDSDTYRGLMEERRKKSSGLPHGDSGFFPAYRGGLE
ncbi:MAG TPA: GNAT family N-acetyltransferase [Rhodospirillales bacterium]|nr:GNAT family N-acetyltransferase [Rhodospirillales bacterium]